MLHADPLSSFLGRARAVVVDLAESGRLPDSALRAGIRSMLRERLREERRREQRCGGDSLGRFMERSYS